MTWPVVPLGSLCSLVNGRAFKADDWTTSGLPIIRIQNLNSAGGFFNYWDGELGSQVVVNPNDLLLAWSGTPGTSFGAHIWNGERGVLNQHIFRVDLNERLVTKEWALRAINNQLGRMIELAHGGVGLKHVTRSTVMNLGIVLPPINEQRRIAAILDQAEALRTKRRQALAHIEALTHSIYEEAFGDTGTHASLDSLADVASGVTKSGAQRESLLNTVPYIRVANVQAGFLNLDEIKTIRASDQEIAKLQLKDGDVLMTEGGDFDKVGRGALWCGEITPCIHQNHVFRVRLDRKKLLPEVFHYFLQSPMAKRYFLRCAKKTSNLASINMTQLKLLPTLLPDMPLQESFVHKIGKVSSTMKSAVASSQMLDEMFQSLQHRAFNGEL